VTLLMLVIGGNTTIFSVVHGLMTKPAPGVQADRLVSLEFRVEGGPLDYERDIDSYPNYVDIAAQAQTIRPLLAFQFERLTLVARDGSYAVSGALASSNYFDVLGVRLAKGRPIADEEGRVDAAGLTAVISHRVWQTHFRGAEDVLGQSIVLNGHPATVVGVAPPRFQGPWFGNFVDVWVPLVSYARIRGAARLLSDRSHRAVTMFGRLAPDASLSQAQAELDAISTRLRTAYPDTQRNKTVTVLPYAAIPSGTGAAEHGPRFIAVFAIVALLTVLIVCANVANLMLTRAVARRREMAVRQSLGASRLRVVRMLFAEGLVLSLVAWVAACLFALGMARVLAALIPPAEALDARAMFAPDWRVAAYAMGLAVLATVAFTLAPAIHAFRQELLPWLKAGEQGIVPGGSILSSVLVVAQLAMAVLLLTGAGLAYRSLSLVDTFDFGFSPDHVLLARISTAGSATSAGTHALLLETVRERLRTVPGVQASSYQGGFWNGTTVRGVESSPPRLAESVAVGPDFLRVLGLTPIAGREFVKEDEHRSARGALVSRNLADALWPGQSALGRTIRIGPQGELAEVIGVTPNGFFSGLRRGAPPHFVFLSMQPQPPAPGDTIVYVRHAGDLAAIAPAIGRALKDLDARIPVEQMQSLAAASDGFTWPARVITILLTIFAVGSLAIAAIGQYAVIAFDLRRRTRDFGVRLALGASSSQLLRTVMREGLRWTAAGLALGFVLSLAAGAALGSLLFGITPTDRVTYAGVFSLLAATSFVACYLPARRAARIDPIDALRQE
jgi:predicted permease